MKKIISILLSLVMIVTSISTLFSFEAFAATAADALNNLDNVTPDGFNDSVNPYGGDKDKGFLLNEESEIFRYVSYDMNDDSKKTSTGTIYDKKNGSYMLGFDIATMGSTSVSADVSSYNDLNYVKTVAFDGNGTGRRNMIAMVGLYKTTRNGTDSNRVYLYVYDTSIKKWASSSLGYIDWISDSTNYYEALNYIDVTAGDYDGDGQDTVVVYADFSHIYVSSTNTSNRNLIECSATSSGSSVSISQKQRSDADQLINPAYATSNLRENSNDANGKSALVGQVETGDFNGDDVDDLVVMTYVSKGADNASNNTTQNVSLYSPYVDVSLGKKSSSFSTILHASNVTFTSKDSTETHFNSGKSTLNISSTKDGRTYNGILAGGLTVGDLTGEGFDSIIVGGTSYSVKDTNSKTSNGFCDGFDTGTADYMNFARFSYSGGSMEQTFVSGATNSLKANELTKHAANTSDDANSGTGLAVVAFNGPSSPSYVFADGALYDWSNDIPSLVHDFTKDSNWSTNFGSRAFVSSVAVGDFDSNNQGYQQIVYTVAVKKKATQRDYDIYTNYIRVSSRDSNGVPVTNSDGSFKTDSWTSASSRITVEDRGDKLAQMLNCSVCSVDSDDDGAFVRYSGKNYLYSDPQVLAVLQAAPYFYDLYDHDNQDIQDAGSTTYSISESWGFSTGHSHSYSVTAGANVSAGCKVLSFDASAGYGHEWSRTWEDSVSYEISETFEAGDTDTVVVYRTPIFFYRYDVYDSETKTWDDDALCVSAAQKPVYQQLTVDEYNEYVDSYTATLAAKGNQNKTLTKLEDSYLGNEGDPYSYRRTTAGATLYGNTTALGTTGGTKTTEYNVSSESSDTTEKGNGFYFEFSLQLGYKGETFEALGGIESSLEYMKGSSSSTVKGKGISYSGTVADVNGSTFRSLGYTDEQLSAYHFNWKLCKWNSNIPGTPETISGTTSSTYIPVIGYYLTDVASLPLCPIDLDYETEDNLIKLTWELDPNAKYPVPTGYKVYLAEPVKTGYDYKLLGQTTNTSFDFTDLTPGRSEYIFVVHSYNSTGESLDSEWLTAYVDGSSSTGIESISKIDSKTDTNGRIVDTYRIKYTDGTYYDYTVTNGKDGAQGATGAAGQNGKTAYECAKENGYDGTYEEWLNVIGAVCEKDGHTFTNYKINATCTQDGAELKVCSVCGWSEITTTAKKNHNYTTTEYSATCTERGYKLNTCSKCGDQYTSNVTEATGHSYTSAVTAPTCTASGYTTYTCSACGEEYSANFVAPLGHDYDTVVTAPTCKASGYTRYTCKTCGISYTDNITTPIAHNYVASVTKPTCTSIGFTLYTCSNCGEQYMADIKNANGHDYSTIVTAPTCTSKGYTTYTCTTCGDHFIDDITDTTSHNFEQRVVNSTCFTGGYTLNYCTVCNAQFISNETSAKGHNFEVTKVVAPTCMSKGYSVYTCADCGINYNDDETDTLEHTYITRVNEPTCTVEGYNLHVCQACGASKVDEFTKAKGHKNETVITKATTSKNGSIVTKCCVCEDVFATKTISKIKSVTLSKTVYDYDAKVKEPVVKVVDANGKTISSNNYVVTYTNNKEVGTATAIITFNSDYYEDVLTSKFTIKTNVVKNNGNINRNAKEKFTSAGLTTSWGKVSNADGYDIFAVKCGKNDMPKKPTLNIQGNNSTSATLSKVAGKKLDNTQCYKVQIKAYRMINGKKTYIASTYILHSAGSKNKTYTNAKAVNVKKSKVSIKVGKTSKISASTVKQDNSKKLLDTIHAPYYRYYSSNKTVATVDKNGKITAKTKGTCRAYVIAQNGVKTYVTVTVK